EADKNVVQELMAFAQHNKWHDTYDYVPSTNGFTLVVTGPSAGWLGKGRRMEKHYNAEDVRWGYKQLASDFRAAAVAIYRAQKPLDRTGRPSQNSIVQSDVEANARNTRSAGFQTCCIADFQIGSMLERPERSQVWKPAIQQTWKSALRFGCEMSRIMEASNA